MADVIVMEAGRQERTYWRDLWRFRELFYVLAWRDIAVRYKQTVVGIAWGVIRPVLTMLIFTIVSSAVVPHDWRFWYSLNPIVGVIDGFRWCVLRGASPLYLPGFALSIGIVAFFLWLGIAYFRRTERMFADLI